MDRLFYNIEEKLKTLAKINLLLGFVFSVFFFIILGVITGYTDFYIIFGILGTVALVLLAFISSWGIYAFAEILESTKETNRILKIGFAQDIASDKLQQETKSAAAQESVKAAEQERIKAEKTKQARIEAYWIQHSEEKKALLEKRTAAEMKLKEIGGLAFEQKKTLQDLIQAIDNELARDREE